MAKYVTFVLALLCAFQLFQLYEAARLVPRSADGTGSETLDHVGDSLSRTFDSVKEGLSDLVKKAPSVDDLVTGVSSNFQKLSGQVESLTRQLTSSVTGNSTAH